MPIVIEQFESQALRGNALGDPTTRAIPVYLPPSYDSEPNIHYPVVYLLHGFTGTSLGWLNNQTFGTLNVPQRFERLVQQGKCGEMILVFPDGFTSLGGSQFLNSPATGNYEDYIIQDLIPYIDQKFRTIPERIGRGVAGKSSGGYGAVRLAMRHPKTFAAMASHAGDMYFEYCYKADFPKVCNALAKYKHSPNPIGAWLAEFYQTEKKTGKLIEVVNILAMSSCYSPRSTTEGNEPTFELPFDLHSGLINQTVWERWLTNDPIYMLDNPQYVENLESYRLLYLDAGTRDEFNLHLGARIFAAKARQHGLQMVQHEFEDGHMDINYRYETSLPAIWHALQG
jgi:enterochelin esterase family protein